MSQIEQYLVRGLKIMTGFGFIILGMWGPLLLPLFLGYALVLSFNWIPVVIIGIFWFLLIAVYYGWAYENRIGLFKNMGKDEDSLPLF